MNCLCRILFLAAVALGFATPRARAQSEVLLREVVSREVSISVGGVDSEPVKEAVSREFSISVENGSSDLVHDVVSREYDLLIDRPGAPPAVTPVAVTVSPTGDSATLDWSGFNQWAVGDIQLFNIYFSDAGPFSDVTGMTPFATVGSGSTTVTLDGLAAYTDHYFAIVAVDAFGNFNPAVIYSAAYILSPQVISREVSLFIGQEPAPPYKQVISREYDLAMVSAAPPPVIPDVAVSTSPLGDTATLNWSAYNQWAVGDIQRFDIYLSDSGAFTNVSGMTPVATVGGGATTFTLQGLTPGTDHFFAVVPVDALGNFDSTVIYSAAYVLSPELISREYSLFIGQEPPSAPREVVSREVSLAVADGTVPAPVTGPGSGFTAVTSTSAFGAVDLNWTSYNELAQNDVVRYRVYVSTVFFDTVAGLTPYQFVQSGRQVATIAGFAGGSIRHFAVVAEDAGGNFNPAVYSFSAQASIAGVGEVTSLAGDSQATSILFTWGPPPDSAGFLLAYHVYFGGAALPVVLGPAATSWEATGLSPASGYPFRITTVDLFGEESSGSSLVGATLLPNPANVSLTARSGNVVLVWDAVLPAALVSHYEVYQSSAAFTDIFAATLIGAGPALESVVGTFASAQGQHFAVVAVNTLGSSDPAVVSVVATKALQTINFPLPVVSGSAPISLNAIATSGLPVSFGLTPPGIGTVNTSGPVPQLIALQGGRVTVTAMQDGNINFWPAEAVAHLLRLPPLITSFTADGEEIENAAVLTNIDEVLRVVALDTDGISRAEFFIRPVGGGAFTSLGADIIPGNGLSVILPLDAYAAGTYDLKVRVETPETVASETMRSVVLQLGPPPAPLLSTPADGTRVDTPLLTVTGTTSRSSQVVIFRNGVQVAGPLTPNASGVFSTSVTLLPGDNLLTARATNAAGNGPISQGRTVTLRSLLTVTITPPALEEGQAGTLRVSRNHNHLAVSVAMSSNAPGQLIFPASVSIPNAASEVTVAISAVNDAVAELDAGVIVTGSAATYLPGSDTVTVIDNDRPELTVTLNRSTVSEGAAPGELVATFTRAPVTAAPFTVLITSTNEAAVLAPAAVTIPGFTASAAVLLVVVNNSDPGGDQSAGIYGRILDVTNGQPLAESNEATLTITDDDGPTLFLRISRAAVREGNTVNAVLARNSGFGSALTAALSVDDATEASIPPTVQFAAGETEKNVLISGLEDSMPDGNQPVLVHASAPGFAAAEAALVVTDLVLPDLAVSRVTVPPTALTDDFLIYSYRIENQGPEDVTVPVSVRVLLSRDALPGDDENVETYDFGSGLPAGLFFERAGTLFTPRDAGSYWLLVEADYGGGVTEILESNNLRASSPVRIGAAYEATVGASLTIAPGGTPVPMTGLATNLSDNSPAAFKLVNVHVMVRDTTRILSALTNSAGQFSLTFTPLPGEGGSYTIGATHPGVAQPEVQDAFTLLGFSALPATISATVARNGPQVAGSLVVKNLADLPMNGLSVSGIGLPAGFSLTGSVQGGATSVAALGEFSVDYLVSATAAAPALGGGSLRISSSEGAVLDIPVSLTARDLESRLARDGGTLERGMVPGSQTFVTFTVRNEGSVPSGPVRIILPLADWLSTASPSPMPSIEPGAEAEISLHLNPASTLPLTAYSGSFQVAGNHNTLTIPFTFRALSDAITAVTVNCEDEYTYFAASTPPLAGATVTLCDAISGAAVTSGLSGVDGRVIFSAIPEGYYRVKATAPQHSSYERTLFVSAGAPNEIRAFLSRQTVRYVWNVVPTTIQDRYKIIVESIFETNVPAPVVVVEPTYIDLEALTEDVTQIDLKITNHGLIAVRDTAVRFTSTSEWQIESLSENLGTLPARSSLTVPVIIRRVGGAAARAVRGGAGGCIVPAGEVEFCFECGDKKICGRVGIGFSSSERCPPGSVTGGGAGGGGTTIVPQPVDGGGLVTCDPCMLKAVLECYLSFVMDPVSACIWSGGNTYKDCSQSGLTRDCGIDIIQGGAGCVCGFAKLTVAGIGVGTICNAANCFIDVLQCLYPGGPPPNARRPRGGGSAYAGILAEFEQAGNNVMALADFQVAIFGDEAWRPLLDLPEIAPFIAILRSSLDGTTAAERSVSAAERAQMLATPFGTMHAALVSAWCDRLNRTITYNDQGIFNAAQVPAGQSQDFFSADSLLATSDAAVAAVDAARADGFIDPVEAFGAARDELFHFLSQGGGVCARVKLRIEQEAVMARDAFEASLDLINNVAAPVEGVEVSIKVRDVNGVDVSGLFGITPPAVTGSTGGMVPGNSTATWRWTIIPTQDAAPAEAVVYLVEGSLRYSSEGEEVTVPLAPKEITVFPNPSLRLKYFHQRDVFSDDPHTDVIEPSIPFTLGVMVQNLGAGRAQNLRITSGQPEIVDNEKGLFIDFDIIATEVAGQNLHPGLTADFGDIQPGEIKVGRWLMTSTLHGLFINYAADFEHLDDLGNERLSLIEGVEIHETLHQIEALGAKFDGLPDFLVNDVPDVLDLPDTVHLSDGTTAPVTVTTDGTAPAPAAGALSVILTAPAMSAGWCYLRMPDPGNGTFRLTSVTRSDGLSIPLDVNVWATDRTFIGLGLRPVRENLLHLVDCNSTGSYTLVYAMIPPPDVLPPVSAVAALPAASGHFIPVAWGGSDNTGITGYDVFVSVNGGPFTRWIENTRNTTALYSGVLGNSYAFYSIARDASGNEEPAKTLAEATTTVSLENQPPTLAFIPNLTIPEGLTLSHLAIANDPDGPEDLLRFSIESPQPGLVIGSQSGLIRWITGELHGGLTIPVTVTVTDGASQPRSSSRQFQVTVIETNSAPQLTHPGNRVIDVGDILQIQLIASDPDQPAQVVRYGFGAPPPAGMTLNAVTGLLQWVPGDSHEAQVFNVILEAFDDQTPAGVGRITLRVEVLKKPGLPPEFEESPVLIWQEAGTFSQTFRASDPEGEPVTVSADTSALPGWALAVTNADQSVTLYWNTTGAAPGTYDLPLLAATARQETRIAKAIQILPRATYSSYAEWTQAYGLTGPAADPGAQLHPSLFGNLISYALALDPVGGISPAQGRPLPHFPFSGPNLLGFRFLMPAGGRPDLRYLVERNPTLDPDDWEIVATKDGLSPWTGTWTVSQQNGAGTTRWTTVVPPSPAMRRATMRLRVELR